MIPEAEMVRLFKKAAQLGAGIEINSGAMVTKKWYEESVLRIFKTAKKCGCKFYLGSDAHFPSELEVAKERFEKVIDLPGLNEEDKFYIQK